MTRADLVDRLVRAIRRSETGAVSGVCSGCEAEIELRVSGEAMLAEKLIDELDHDGLEIVKK